MSGGVVPHIGAVTKGQRRKASAGTCTNLEEFLRLLPCVWHVARLEWLGRCAGWLPSPMNRFLLIIVLTFAFPLAACATHYIPNTDVEDTSDNRNVIAFCEKYRKALETQNVGSLLSMASPRYYEDGGNVDPSDDLDYEGLREWLQGRFQEARGIRYEIRYRRVSKGPHNRVYILYTYSASYKIPGLKQEEWRRTVAENRLELLPDGRSFKITAGM